MKKLLLCGISLAALIAFNVSAENGAAAEKKQENKVVKATKKVAEKAKKAKLPAKEITYLCSYDNSEQPALVMVAKSKEPRPLFVTLHTWSSDYRQCNGAYARRLIGHDVHMIAPNFRGKNTVGNNLSMGSDAAISDIIDAVKYMQKNYNVDNDRIYLVGGSGGGYMSLLTSSRNRNIWAAVSSWCPISDIVTWHAYYDGKPNAKKSYGTHIEKNIGNPKTDEKVKAEALKRSPVTWLEGVTYPLDISHGLFDRVVPVEHAIRAFNKVAAPKDRFTEEEIKTINAAVDSKKVLAKFPALPEKLGTAKIYVRRVSGNVRLTIFHAGHSIMPGVGIQWLLKQQKGKPADFSNIKSNESSAALGR